MTEPEIAYEEELTVALETAMAAGNTVEEYAADGFDSWEKDDGSSVTEADLASQELIVEALGEAFPDDGILAEEEELTPDGQDRVWVIDPVDGTFNYWKGFGHYCISIALEIDDDPVVGVVHMPDTGGSFYAVRGQGAYYRLSPDHEPVPIEVTDHEGLDGALFFLTLFDIHDGQIDWETGLLKDLAEEGAAHRQLGSAALELCYLAAGKVDMLVNPMAKHWDYAAGVLIAVEAGATVSLDDGFDGSTRIVAANDRLFEELEPMVEDQD